MMRKVNLLLEETEPAMGLIIECPSGIIFHNQAGGYCCTQPETEGIFLPIRASENTYNTLLGFFSHAYLKNTPRPTSQLNNWSPPGCLLTLLDSEIPRLNLILHSLIPDLPLSLNKNKIAESQEAWLYVQIHSAHSDEHSTQLHGFNNSCAILVWGNSD